MIVRQRDAAVPPAPSRLARPLCFLVEENFSVRQDLARELRRHGIDVVEFSNSARITDMVDERSPDIVFIGVNQAAPHKCVRALLALKESAYCGAVQLFGHGDARILESFNTIGADCALTMLPPLMAPLEFAAVHRIVLDRKLVTPATPSVVMSLDVALARKLVQFLYQPKLELKTGVMLGAELVVRVADAERGLLTPGQFLKDAHEDTLLDLSRLAVTEALQAGEHFLKFGVALRLSVNIGAGNLLELPLADLMSMHRPQRSDWPGLILEVPARQVVNKIASLKARSPQLQQLGIAVAIDNFGPSAFNLSILNELAFAEIKIDRALVDGCATDPGNANMCRTIVQMAHNFGSKAVAVGISTEADLKRLAELGCDMGQGFLLGKPISRQQMDALIANFKIQTIPRKASSPDAQRGDTAQVR